MKQLGYYVLATFLLTACQSYKKVPYLQDAEGGIVQYPRCRAL